MTILRFVNIQKKYFIKFRTFNDQDKLQNLICQLSPCNSIIAPLFYRHISIISVVDFTEKPKSSQGQITCCFNFYPRYSIGILFTKLF